MSANSGKLVEDPTRSRLGRGLAALIGDMAAETSVDRPRGQRRLPTASLQPNPRNPRRVFANAELDELVASLRERGIIQPIIARPAQGAADLYEIIAGERRWRAAQRAGLHEVPVVIIEASDAERLIKISWSAQTRKWWCWTLPRGSLCQPCPGTAPLAQRHSPSGTATANGWPTPVMKIVPSSRFPGTAQLRIARGRENACRQKRSGRKPRAARTRANILGGTRSQTRPALISTRLGTISAMSVV